MVAIRNDCKPTCPKCGSPVTMGLLEERECAICHAKSVDKEVCEQGHFVCDECRKKYASKAIYNKCIDSDSKDPVALSLEIMSNKSIRMHDLKHHTMVASCLLTAYKNCGGDIDLDAALRDADKRGSWFPGGVCGLAGTCGAAASTGIFYSIITKTTPHSKETWSDTNRIVANSLFKISDINGPRCCKRNSFIAMIEATDYVEEKMGVKMETTRDIRCPYFARNEECIKAECPFYKE